MFERFWQCADVNSFFWLKLELQYIRGITQLRWNFQVIKVLFFVIMPDSVGGSFIVACGARKALFYLSCHQAGISVSGINHTRSLAPELQTQ